MALAFHGKDLPMRKRHVERLPALSKPMFLLAIAAAAALLGSIGVLAGIVQ
jgi:hypothetical protein